MTLYRVAGFQIEMKRAHALPGGAHCFPVDACFSVTENEVRRQFSVLTADDYPAAEEAALCSKFYHWLPLHRAMSIHASALAYDGRGVLFLGPSGTGKSTHARMWRETYGRVVMINDDEPILRFSDSAVTVCGSPWRGKEQLGADMCAPLAALVVLQQADGNRIERLSPAQAMPFVLLQTMRPRTDAEADALFELIDTLLSAVPVYRLYCTASADAAVLCKETTLGGEA